MALNDAVLDVVLDVALKGGLTVESVTVEMLWLKSRIYQRDEEVYGLAGRISQRDEEVKDLQRQLQESTAQLHEKISAGTARHQLLHANAMNIKTVCIRSLRALRHRGGIRSSNLLLRVVTNSCRTYKSVTKKMIAPVLSQEIMRYDSIGCVRMYSFVVVSL